MSKILISITHGADDADRATVGFVLAGAAVASEQETTVFLSTEGVRLAEPGVADGLHEEGFAPLKELMASFLENGGQILVCSPCAKKRGITEDKLVSGATIVGGARVIELMASGAQTLTY